MADQTWAIAMAIDVQSAFGTINGTISALSGTLDQTDGMILGDKASGEADSGITVPNIVAVVRENPVVAASFTEQWDAYLRTAVEGLSIAFPLQGNGADAGAPTADAASPLVGPNAILQAAGLIETTGGGSPDVDFKPNASTVYATIKLWLGSGTTGLSFVYQDCLVDTLSLSFPPGSSGIATAGFKVGSLATQADGVTFPTVTYGTMASLASPVVEGVAHAWGATRGFENLTINIANTLEEFGDSNVTTTGLRQSQTRRLITVDGAIYMTAAAAPYEYDNLVGTSAPTDDLSFQVGDPDVGGAETALNAYKVTVANLSAQNLKYEKRGTATVAVLSGAKATDTAAGGEFTLTFN